MNNDSVSYRSVVDWMLVLIAGVFVAYEVLYPVLSGSAMPDSAAAWLADAVNCTVMTAVTLVAVTAAVVMTRRHTVRHRIAAVAGAALLTSVAVALLSMLWHRVTTPAVYVTAVTMLLSVAAMVYAVNILVYDVDRQAKCIAELDRRHTEMQLDLLQAYVSPHFLFNGLNTIGSLVHDDPSRAERYIDNLSGLLRYMLQNRNRRTVPIDSELANLRQYLYLLDIRFGTEVRVDIAPNMKGFHVCPGALQLLVENAIKHNAHSTESPLTISITDDGDHVTVTNNVMPLAGDTTHSTGLGYDSINTRLAMLGHDRVTCRHTGDRYMVSIPKLEETI